MIFFNRLMHTVGSALRIGRKSLKKLPNRPTPQMLVVLDGKNVIGFSRLDLLGNRSLCTHGVQSHDTSLQGQGLQQLRNRCFFIGFLARGLLPENQGSLCGKSAYQVQWWLSLASATTTGLAVNGNHFG